MTLGICIAIALFAILLLSVVHECASHLKRVADELAKMNLPPFPGADPPLKKVTDELARTNLEIKRIADAASDGARHVALIEEHVR